MTSKTSDDTNRVVTKGRRNRALDPAPEVGGIAGTRGIGTPTAIAGQTGGGGIEWPLEELPYDGTEWHTVVSSDGLFVMQFPIYSDLEDAAGTVGRLNYAAP
jgi:hypothetical protein